MEPYPQTSFTAPQPGGNPSTGLRLATPQSRAEQLAAALEERIRTQGLRAGDSVGTLQSLRDDTGFARATVSEAVRLLKERGMLEIRPGRGGGLFVTDLTPVVRLRHTLLTVSEEPSTVLDAIELRESLEMLVAQGAARSRSTSDIAELEALLGRMEGAPDWNGFMQANWALHARIARICPNAMARAVYVGTLGYLSSTAASRYDEEGSAASPYRASRHQVHAQLVRAIADGEPEAVAVAIEAHRG